MILRQSGIVWKEAMLNSVLLHHSQVRANSIGNIRMERVHGKLKR